MTNKEKLKISFRFASAGAVIVIFSGLFLVMSFVKGMYVSSYESDFFLSSVFYSIAMAIIDATINIDYVGQLFNWGWNNISHIPLERDNLLNFYKSLMPPLGVGFIGMIFVADHINAKRDYMDLKREVEREKRLQKVRKEEGVATVDEAATVDIYIDDKRSDKKLWKDTIWGQVLIGVLIALVVAAFGID